VVSCVFFALSLSAYALENGTYTITSKHSGKLVEVGNADTADGANINQWPSNGHPTQQWVITRIGGDDYSVVNANSNLAMEVYNFDSSDGANVVQWTYWGGDPQIWTITEEGSGYYLFINKHSGKALDLLDWDTSDGANIGQWSWWGGDTQLWSLQLVESGSSQPINFVTPNFDNIAVHDPSVIRANNNYYVFGSHLSAARSSQLTSWERVADGVTPGNPLFNNVTSELSEALSWAETSTLWAPDVIELNGQYLMFYNACRGDSPRSAMGIARSSNIEGPYSNAGIFLKSGMWGEASEDGSIYDANVHPNVVDPVVFRDAGNRLWMTYGSYSGGIFIMELDPGTGFPYPGQGYGTHLHGGNHARTEGAYTIYAPETGYYYMFVSYGGLAADGGYNIRVSRATSPAGPYYDAQGTNMASVKGAAGTIFDDASIAPHGVKLMGNHLFANSGNELGYVSPGHNSAYRKADTGQYFIFFHTRFPGRGEEHEVRVHEFFFNEAGWPVVSPLRYAEKVDSNNPNRSRAELEAVNASEIPGAYQLVNHGKDISPDLKHSADIYLNAGASISGAQSGSWVYSQAARAITVSLNGTSYRGVVSRQWNQARQRFEVTFSALSGDGTAVWGIKSD
jgi:arabinan endo-1,5-alpha-L-arabinosidase